MRAVASGTYIDSIVEHRYAFCSEFERLLRVRKEALIVQNR